MRNQITVVDMISAPPLPLLDPQDAQTFLAAVVARGGPVVSIDSRGGVVARSDSTQRSLDSPRSTTSCSCVLAVGSKLFWSILVLEQLVGRRY